MEGMVNSPLVEEGPQLHECLLPIYIVDYSKEW